MSRNKWMWFIFVLLHLNLVACDTDQLTDVKDDRLVEDMSELTDHEAESVGDAAYLIAEYDRFVEDVIQDTLVPGAAVAIIYQDEIIYAHGYGQRDIDAQLLVTTDTLFHIGSTNKSMTALLVATLVDEGLIDWDTPVAEIYPDFTLTAGTDQVTMRHLLSMTSGIPDTAEDRFDTDYGTAEKLFTYVETVNLPTSPGKAFSYSNISASLAGYIAVLALDPDTNSLYDSYAALLTERVLRPIGMTTAVVSVDDARKSPHYGKSYIFEGNEPIEAEPSDFVGDPLAPSGIVKANVMEMARYVQTQLNHGLAPNGTQVVSPENMAIMWEPQLEGYALGWELSHYNGVQVISHEGAFDNYLSVIGFVPELELGYVVLTNSEDTGEALVLESPEFLIDTILSE